MHILVLCMCCVLQYSVRAAPTPKLTLTHANTTPTHTEHPTHSHANAQLRHPHPHEKNTPQLCVIHAALSGFWCARSPHPNTRITPHTCASSMLPLKASRRRAMAWAWAPARGSSYMAVVFMLPCGESHSVFPPTGIKGAVYMCTDACVYACACVLHVL